MRKLTHIRIALLSFTLGLPLALSAQLIRVDAQPDRDTVRTGEPFTLKVVVTAASGMDIRFLETGDTLGTHLELVSNTPAVSRTAEGKQILNQDFVLATFEPGRQMIPCIEVLYTFQGSADTARSMPMFIEVWEPVIDTTAELKPLKAPMNTPVSFAELAPYIAIGLGAAGVIALFILFILPLLIGQKSPLAMKEEPEEPAHVIAFRELDKLKDEKLWERGVVKDYYSELSRIVREYIERQYGIQAMESITSEILLAFRKQNVDVLLHDLLSELLQLSDLVKFAKGEPLPEENLGHLNNLYLFIQKTYPDFYREESNE